MRLTNEHNMDVSSRMSLDDNKLDIFIVEDDFVLAKEIKLRLEKYGYTAQTVVDLQNITNEVLIANPKLILMDINLPYKDGFQWCNEIRRFLKVPIIFISSRDSDMDIIMSINMGGDDYIVKPFSIQLLIAKVQAVFRRAYSYNITADKEIIKVGPITLNIADGTVIKDGIVVELSRNEFKILHILMQNAGSIVSRDDIMDALWSTDEFIGENTLTVNVTRLRNKLKSIGLDDYIKTKKGQGYIIEDL